MSIKYEIHGIKNAKGEGKEQKYVHLFAHEPQSDHLTSSLKKYVFYNWLINNILYLCVT